MINDIWGLKWDGTMAKVIADAGVPCCLMHNRHDMNYRDIVEDIVVDLNESIKIALAAGILEENIMLDPGIGFAKGPAQYEFICYETSKADKTVGISCFIGDIQKIHDWSYVGSAGRRKRRRNACHFSLGTYGGLCSVPGT